MDTLSPTAKIVLGAVAALLFICASAAFFYRTGQEIVDSQSLENHSAEVFTRLLTVSAQLDQIDYLVGTYLVKGNAGDKNAVQMAQGVIDSTLSDLEKLIWSSKQRDRGRLARACTGELTQQVNTLFASQQSSAMEKEDLTRKMLECRDLISQMEVAEGILMRQRTMDANQRAHANLLSGGVFVLVSLFAVLTLFGLLLRDVRKLAETEAQIVDTNDRLKRTVQELNEKAAETDLITSMRNELQLCATAEEAHVTTVRYVAKALPNAQIALMTVDNARKMMKVAATSSDETLFLDEFPINACCGVRLGRPRRRKAGESEIECGHFLSKPPEEYLCLPLAAHGETLGVLYIGYPRTRDAEELEIHHEVIKKVSELAPVWIATLNLRAQLEELSVRDGLTNLYNRRFMEMALEREVLLAIRHKTDLSVLMLDIDHFKYFNDTFGHGAGDDVLRGIAEILRHGVRAEDIVCRYGGEELLLILPGTGVEVARERAEEIRRRIREMQLDIPSSGSKKVTVSIGVAIFPRDGQTSEELVGSADRALYLAKSNGRDRVEATKTVVAA